METKIKTLNGLSHKQCNTIYRAFKQGDLKPPYNEMGYRESPGFVYRFEGKINVNVDGESEYFLAAQIDTMAEIARYIMFDWYKAAQELLDGKNYNWIAYNFPESADRDYIWKVV